MEWLDPDLDSGRDASNEESDSPNIIDSTERLHAQVQDSSPSYCPSSEQASHIALANSFLLDDYSTSEPMVSVESGDSLQLGVNNFPSEPLPGDTIFENTMSEGRLKTEWHKDNSILSRALSILRARQAPHDLPVFKSNPDYRTLLHYFEGNRIASKAMYVVHQLGTNFSPVPCTGSKILNDWGSGKKNAPRVYLVSGRWISGKQPPAEAEASLLVRGGGYPKRSKQKTPFVQRLKPWRLDIVGQEDNASFFVVVVEPFGEDGPCTTGDAEVEVTSGSVPSKQSAVDTVSKKSAGICADACGSINDIAVSGSVVKELGSIGSALAAGGAAKRPRALSVDEMEGMLSDFVVQQAGLGVPDEGKLILVRERVRQALGDLVGAFRQQTAQWPDFVFTNEYGSAARNFDDVMKFVRERGHLPYIRSAEEVERDGVQVERDLPNVVEALENLFLFVEELRASIDRRSSPPLIPPFIAPTLPPSFSPRPPSNPPPSTPSSPLAPPPPRRPVRRPCIVPSSLHQSIHLCNGDGGRKESENAEGCEARVNYDSSSWETETSSENEYVVSPRYCWNPKASSALAKSDKKSAEPQTSFGTKPSRIVTPRSPRNFRFGAEVSSETEVSDGGLSLRRTTPTASGPDMPMNWRGGMLEPPFASSGRAYVEFEVVAAPDCTTASCVGSMRGFLGVTDAEAGYPAGGDLFRSPGAWMFYCGNSLAVSGDQIYEMDIPLHGPRYEFLANCSRKVGDRVGLLVHAGLLFVYINGVRVGRPVTQTLPTLIAFAVDLSDSGEQVRVVKHVDDPLTRWTQLVEVGGGGFRFAGPPLLSARGATISKGGLVLTKDVYRLSFSSKDAPLGFVSGLLEPPLQTAERAYVEFEVEAVGKDVSERILFGVTDLSGAPEGHRALFMDGLSYMIDPDTQTLWHAGAGFPLLTGSMGPDFSKLPPDAARRPPRGCAVGDRVGLLVVGGRLKVFINGLWAFFPDPLPSDVKRSLPGSSTKDIALPPTVRFGVDIPGFAGGTRVRIVQGAVPPFKDLSGALGGAPNVDEWEAVAPFSAIDETPRRHHVFRNLKSVQIGRFRLTHDEQAKGNAPKVGENGGLKGKLTNAARKHGAAVNIQSGNDSSSWETEDEWSSASSGEETAVPQSGRDPRDGGGHRGTAVRNFRFADQVSPETKVLSSGLSLRRTSHAAVGPDAPMSGRGGLLEPPVASSGRAYVEFVLVAAAKQPDRDRAAGMHCFLGVVDAENGYLAGGDLHRSPGAWMYYCGNSIAISGDEPVFFGAPLHGPRNEPIGCKPRSVGDRVGLLVHAGSLFVYINGVRVGRPVTRTLPELVAFAVDLSDRGEQVRLVSKARDPLVRWDFGGDGFRFAGPPLLSARGAIISGDGLVLIKDIYRPSFSSVAPPYRPVLAFLDPAVRTAERAYVEFLVEAAVGNLSDSERILFGVTELQEPTAQCGVQLCAKSFTIDPGSQTLWHGGACLNLQIYPFPRKRRPRNAAAGDRVGLLVAGGRLGVFINGNPAFFSYVPPFEHPAYRSVVENQFVTLPPTVRFMVNLPESDGGTLIRIIKNAVPPCRDILDKMLKGSPDIDEWETVAPFGAVDPHHFESPPKP